MSMMNRQRLHELLDKLPDKNILSWSGQCHDCQTAVQITAVPQPDGIHIQGGAVYEPMAEQFFLKCDACHRADPTLRNYQACEVYSRVVGYLRPVAQWNDGKQSEFALRKTFDGSLAGGR